MDDSTKVEELRLLTESDEDDSILLSFLGQAKNALFTRLYPYATDDDYSCYSVPAKYDYKQVRIAAYLMNKRGAEGEIAHIENGIHRNYKNSDVPYDMLVDVLPMIGIPR